MAFVTFMVQSLATAVPPTTVLMTVKVASLSLMETEAELLAPVLTLGQLGTSVTVTVTERVPSTTKLSMGITAIDVDV